jgi:hypothetical protein
MHKIRFEELWLLMLVRVFHSEKNLKEWLSFARLASIPFMLVNEKYGNSPIYYYVGRGEYVALVNIFIFLMENPLAPCKRHGSIY